MEISLENLYVDTLQGLLKAHKFSSHVEKNIFPTSKRYYVSLQGYLISLK